jgi:hypothetical protein
MKSAARTFGTGCSVHPELHPGLRQAGVERIVVVVGYRAEQFGGLNGDRPNRGLLRSTATRHAGRRAGRLPGQVQPRTARTCPVDGAAR